MAVAILPATLIANAPQAGASKTDCLSYAYDCTPGYNGANASGTWAWSHYGGSWAQTPNGYHNCTLYAAWRLQQSGMGDPGNWGNAGDWAAHNGGGNSTPAVGAIAWWGSGHVAYVEQVSGNTVFIRADNFSYTRGYTDAGWIPASSVDKFLHPHDAPIPPPPPGPVWAASYDMSEAPWGWAAGETRSFNVRVTNTGNQTWPSTGTNLVHLGLHFLSPGGGAWSTDQRFELPSDLAPGGVASIPITISAPRSFGGYVLEAEMVKELQFWFAQSARVSSAVTWPASYDISSTPSSWTAGQTQSFSVRVTNSGDQVWPSTGPNRVRLGMHFANTARGAGGTWFTDRRFELPSDLAPGASVAIPVTITAPASGGNYVLEAEMVKELQFWFGPSAGMAAKVAAPLWAASYDVSAAPSGWTAGQTRSFNVRVTNTGNQTWPSTGTNLVHLGLHFANATGGTNSTWYTDQRFEVPADLAPGDTVAIPVTITAPTSGGSYVLEAQMVKELQFWFPQFADVSAGAVVWAASYDVSAAPSSWTAGQTRSFNVRVTNTGNQTWPSTGTNLVRLGLHFQSTAGGSWLTDQRFELPSDLAPGASVAIPVTITAPTSGGGYMLEAQMVKELQFWFPQTADTAAGVAAPLWAASYDVSAAPSGWTAGQTRSFNVRVTNTGNQTWPSTGTNLVHLGLHFANATGGTNSTWYTDQRFELPADLAPGDTVAIPVTITAPNRTGTYVLEAQIVKELQFWFPQTADTAAGVAAPLWAASYDVSAAPSGWTAGQTRSFNVRVTNTGNQTWPSTGTNLVHLGLHFANATGGTNSTWYTDQRFEVPADLAPGDTVAIPVTITAPTSGGSYVLEAQMVKELQFWFPQFADVSAGAVVWAASYDVSAAPSSWTAGQTRSFNVRVTNTGNQTWPSTGTNLVRLGLHFQSTAGGSWLTDQRFELPSDLAPGASVAIPVTITAPTSGGGYMLEAQMVKELQFWFPQTADTAAGVAAPLWAASYDVSAAPSGWTAGQTRSFNVRVTNTGNQTWPSTGTNLVHLGLHFANATGGTNSTWYTDQRFELPADLAPGDTVAIPVTITAPNRTGTYVLEAQIVKELQFWFPQTADTAGDESP